MPLDSIQNDREAPPARPGSPLLIVGASARAAAASAIRAGFRPCCVDLFADRDLQALAPVLRCPAAQYPHALPELVGRVAPPDAPVLFTGAMENHVAVVRQIEMGRRSLCPDAEAMARARVMTQPAIEPGRRYLLKPIRSAGGRFIRAWQPGEAFNPETHYLQEYMDGMPVSAVYLCGELFGVTEQIIGDDRLGAGGFTYCGSVGPLALTPSQLEPFLRIGRDFAAQFGLRGVFGVDAILDDADGVYPVEINPRYTASVEVIERATGRSVLGGATERRNPGTCGKAIVFARANLIAPDLYQWFDASMIADVPAVGEPVQRGQPICTLLARADSRAACLTRLHANADALYTYLRA